MIILWFLLAIKLLQCIVNSMINKILIFIFSTVELMSQLHLLKEANDNMICHTWKLFLKINFQSAVGSVHSFFFFLLECNGSDWKQVWTWNCTMGKFSSSKETLVKFVFQFPSYGWEVPRQNFLPLIKFRLLSLWNRLLPAFHVLLPLVYTFSFSLSNAKISWSLPLWYLF